MKCEWGRGKPCGSARILRKSEVSLP
jgi:hypothetical protein